MGKTKQDWTKVFVYNKSYHLSEGCNRCYCLMDIAYSIYDGPKCLLVCKNCLNSIRIKD